MRDAIKDVAFNGLGHLGVYKRRRQANIDKAIVLTYHGIVPEIPAGAPTFEYRNFVTTSQFEEQIQFLLRNYRPLKAADLYTPGVSVEGGFLITFDDGFRNNYQYAMPILKQYGIQGCFFITTNLIGTRELLWTEQVTLMLERTKKPAVTLELDAPQTFSLADPQQREEASRGIRKHLKLMSSARLRKVMQQMKSQLDDVPLTVGKTEEERYLFMTWDEVREMVANDQLIGAHTHNHPMLATLTEEESWQELSLCKEAIEKETEQPCLTMSYPNGERENYNQMNIEHLKKLGFKCAFTQVPLYNDEKTDLFQLHRVNISLKMSLKVFEATLCGVI